MRRHSFLIGVNKYEGYPGLTDLNCALADVDAVATIESDPELMGPDPHCVTVPNPTLQDARIAFAEFTDKVEKDDVVVFYFTGHGLRNNSGDLFLCFRDSRGKDLELTALNVGVLREVFEAKKLRRVLVVLDCCYSGAAGGMLTKDKLGSPIDAVETALPDGKGVFVLSSAGQAQTAKEGEKHSIFTRHLVEGIKSGTADSDDTGEITVQNVAQYLQQKVPEDAPDQTPLLSAKAQTGSFVIAINRAAKKKRALEANSERFAQAELEVDKRLAEAKFSKDVTLDLMNEVEGWLESKISPAPIDDPLFLAIEDYGQRNIGLQSFVKRWREHKYSDAVPLPVKVEVPVDREPDPPRLPGEGPFSKRKEKKSAYEELWDGPKTPVIFTPEVDPDNGETVSNHRTIAKDVVLGILLGTICTVVRTIFITILDDTSTSGGQFAISNSAIAILTYFLAGAVSQKSRLLTAMIAVLVPFPLLVILLRVGTH